MKTGWRIVGLLAVVAGFVLAAYAFVSRQPDAALPVSVWIGAAAVVVGLFLLHVTRPDPATGFNHPDPNQK
ncbi:MAG: hypothetical protein R2722_13210 [Tessaracoccus sp.]